MKRIVFALAIAAMAIGRTQAQSGVWHTEGTATHVLVDGEIVPTCEGAFSYPGARAGIETTIRYADGSTTYNWQYTEHYIATSVQFDMNKLKQDPANAATSCEWGDWGMPDVDGGDPGWYYHFTYIMYPVVAKSSATTWTYSGVIDAANTTGCDAFGLYRARFDKTCDAPAKQEGCITNGYGYGCTMPGGVMVEDESPNNYRAWECNGVTGGTFANYYDNYYFLGIPIGRVKTYGPSWWDGSCWQPQ